MNNKLNRLGHIGLRVSRNWLVNLYDQPIIILLFHRVTDLEYDPQMLSVSPENFRSQMQFLKSNFQLLRFEDDWGHVRERSVVVTFDDGYADNVVEALPILEELGVPATFFISTGTIGRSLEFWWDELEWIILGQHDFLSMFSLGDGEGSRVWQTQSIAQRQVLYKEMHPLMKLVSAERRNDWFRQLRKWAKIQEAVRESHRPLTIQELIDLSKSSLVTIGGHTVTHTPLSSLPAETQYQEILESKLQLEKWLGCPITVFSYPFGGKVDYNSDSIRLCKQIGFVKVAANFRGQVHRNTDPFQLPRQLVRNWSSEQFAKQIKRFWIA